MVKTVVLYKRKNLCSRGDGMKYKNLVDLHIHSDNSHDAHHSVSLICEKAVERGLAAIAITDHCNLIDYRSARQDVICRQAAFDAFKVKSVFKDDIAVSAGIELGSPARDLEATEDVLKNGFDFVVASVHRIRGKKVSFARCDLTRETNRPELLLPRYFTEVLETAEWNGFDTLAHLTYPLRYFPKELLENLDFSQFDEIIRAILKTVADNGKALEINTKCEPYTMCGKTYRFHPDIDILKQFKELGGEYITVGSDAHSAYDVGNGIEEAYELAETVGFKYVAVYERRKPRLIAIK